MMNAEQSLLPGMRRWILPLVFLFSGISALIYQVVWLRQLTLVFGTTVFAVSAVLAAFMAGLALGSLWLGRRADRLKNPLLVYLFLELGIGVYGLSTPFLFSQIDVLYMPLLAADSPGLLWSNLLRFMLAFGVIMVSTVMMGGTLPVLARYCVLSITEAGPTVGRLYGLNTLGAVLGVIVSGFVLIPFVGVQETLVTAVLINLLIAALMALLLWRRSMLVNSADVVVTGQQDRMPDHHGSREAVGSAESTGGSRQQHAYGLLLAFGLSGFAALGYEVVWTRVLALVIGSSVYAFSTMLLTFLTGLALGSLIMSRLLVRDRFWAWVWTRNRELYCFAVLQLGIGLLVLITIPLLGQLPLLLLALARWLPASFLGLSLSQIGLSFLLMLPVTLLLGALFPLACRIYAVDYHRLGSQVGRLYGVNTLGAILGAIGASFVLIPWLGSEGTLKGLLLLNVITGLSLGWFIVAAGVHRGRHRAALLALALLLGLGAWQLPAWNPLLMNSNIANHLKLLALDKPAEMERYLDSEVIYADEDVTGNVLVYRAVDDSLNLHVAGRGEGGTSPGDMPVQVELAVIPALMHPAPRQARVIGLGPGITLGSLEQMADIDSIDVVEISTAVIKASPYFNDANHQALADARVRLIVDDARHYLRQTDKKYDLIIIGPSYSWVSGSANLFTREFLELTRAHLKPGGLMSLWFQLYAMTPENIKVFINTVNSVFAATSVWLASAFGELIVLGSEQAHGFDYPMLVRRLNEPQIAAEVSRTMAADVATVAGRYLMSGAALQDYVKGSAINTDNKPLLEFQTPRDLYDWDIGRNLESLLMPQRTVSLPVWNLQQRHREQRLYPALGLRLKDPAWQGRADYISQYGFVEAIAAHEALAQRLPSVRTMPRLLLQRDGLALELRTVPARNEQWPTEQWLLQSLTHVTGAPVAAVNKGAVAGRPLYWVSQQGEAVGHYVMTWACPENGYHYLARLEVRSPSPWPDIGTVQGLLGQTLECYQPAPSPPVDAGL